MGITVNLDKAKITLKDYKSISEKQIIDILSRTGEDFVTDTRNQIQSHAAMTYVDKTTALRNSVCYFLFKNGELIKSKTDIHKSGSEAQKGIETSKRIAQRFANFEGYRLLGVAGMNYASFVESKGYNVMSTQKYFAIINLQEYFSYVD